MLAVNRVCFKKFSYERFYKIKYSLRLPDLNTNLGCLGSKDGGRDGCGAWDGHVHTALCEMDGQQGPSVEHRELCSALQAAWRGEGLRGVGTRTCMPESLCCSPETITTCELGRPQHKINSSKEKKLKCSWICYCHKHHPVSTTLWCALDTSGRDPTLRVTAPEFHYLLLVGVENPTHHWGSCMSGS